MKLEHTTLICNVPLCNESVLDNNLNCQKLSCIINSEWINYIKNKNMEFDDKDKSFLKCIKKTNDIVGSLTGRIEEMRLEIDIKLNNKRDHFKGRLSSND